MLSWWASFRSPSSRNQTSKVYEHLLIAKNCSRYLGHCGQFRRWGADKKHTNEMNSDSAKSYEGNMGRALAMVNSVCQCHRPQVPGWLARHGLWVRLTPESVNSAKQISLPIVSGPLPILRGPGQNKRVRKEGDVFSFCLLRWPSHLLSWPGTGIYTISSPGFQALGLGQEHTTSFPCLQRTDLGTPTCTPSLQKHTTEPSQ